MTNFQKGENREEKIDSFLDSISWYFSEKSTPTGFYRKIGEIEQRLKEAISLGEKFNQNIADSNKSSDKLTKAIKNITLWGVIIAGSGLLFEIYKYFI